MLAEKARAAAAAQAPVYIEDVFSTYLYTGTGASKTITNNIDLSGNGGLTWIKSRSAATGHRLTDTVRGVTKSLASETTAAEATESTGLTAFSATGFTIGADGDYNTNTSTYASWTFREQAKFFDIVTYTGTGANRTIAHNLGSVPGMMIVKRTDAAENWAVYHRGFPSPSTQYGILNDYLGTPTTATSVWNSTNPTASVFSVGTNSLVNANGGTYVAYIYAHDAGGFGLSGSDNVISCGSFTTDGSGNAAVTLGWEPQWVMIKDLDDQQYYAIYDNMRGLTSAVSGSRQLFASASLAEGNNPVLAINATGFSINQYASVNYIYIAIRRGPMKVPTSGSTVYENSLAAPSMTTVTSTVISYVDMAILQSRTGDNGVLASRLTASRFVPNLPSAESSGLTNFPMDLSNGFRQNLLSDAVTHLFKRAANFLDVVCYTGTGANTTQTHNLGVVPELMIVKGRSAATAWQVYSGGLANTEYLVLDTAAAKATGATRWNSTTPTSAVFSLGTASEINTSAETYVAHLFATVAGVSKVGSYTGNGSSQTIACGFAAGSRFVLIKRTDSTGDWYVWNSATGIVAGNDPHLSLNTTAAEVTTDDSVDTDNSGFIVNQDAATNVNVSSATYIFLAIA